MLWPYMYHRTAYLSIVSIPSPCNTMYTVSIPCKSAHLRPEHTLSTACDLHAYHRMPFMYVLYYPYYVYSNSFVLSYILEQLLDPLRSKYPHSYV